MDCEGSRMRRLIALATRHPWRATGFVVLLGFLLLNFLAYQHARAMLTFSGEVDRTPPPQSLSTWEKGKVLTCGVTVPRPTNLGLPRDLGLRAETLRFRSADGMQLEGWLIAPPDPRGTVLLCHGYAASRSTVLAEGRVFYEL